MSKYDNYKSRLVKNIFDEDLLEDAFKFYCEANDITDTEKIKKKFFDIYPDENGSKDDDVKEVFVGERKKADRSFRVVLCNQIVRAKDFTASLKGKSSIGDRQQTFERIKDISSKVKDADMLVMAELAMPISSLYGFCMQSAKQEMGVVTGLEFLTIEDTSFNFVATLLPIKVDGISDTVPIIRLKNDYTHGEIQLINGVEGGLRVPEVPKYVYHLYRWRGFSFSTYYCFELANITMRNIFFSKVDFMVVPVWNKDNHYYNALGEATARDLHCYYIQVNTSEFGETRIIEPVSSVKSDLARVKGGTIEDPEFSVSFLVSDLKIKELREAQLLSYSLNKDKDHNKVGFKPLPPNWPYENVKKRISNKRLLD